jgi:hypothetical protein
VDISLNLLSVSVLSSIWPLNIIKAYSVYYKLSLNNINYYLLLASNA